MYILYIFPTSCKMWQVDNRSIVIMIGPWQWWWTISCQSWCKYYIQWRSSSL